MRVEVHSSIPCHLAEHGDVCAGHRRAHGECFDDRNAEPLVKRSCDQGRRARKQRRVLLIGDAIEELDRAFWRNGRVSSSVVVTDPAEKLKTVAGQLM